MINLAGLTYWNYHLLLFTQTYTQTQSCRNLRRNIVKLHLKNWKYVSKHKTEKSFLKTQEVKVTGHIEWGDQRLQINGLQALQANMNPNVEGLWERRTQANSPNLSWCWSCSSRCDTERHKVFQEEFDMGSEKFHQLTDSESILRSLQLI